MFQKELRQRGGIVQREAGAVPGVQSSVADDGEAFLWRELRRLAGPGAVEQDRVARLLMPALHEDQVHIAEPREQLGKAHGAVFHDGAFLAVGQRDDVRARARKMAEKGE